MTLNKSDNVLRKLYELFWVPFFGRLLFRLSNYIEGKDIKDKPTYNIKESSK
tara:strand:+ start:7529 stop:7684 length:156 start_codon:yes stop_codon:yes gene_type:complete